MQATCLSTAVAVPLRVHPETCSWQVPSTCSFTNTLSSSKPERSNTYINVCWQKYVVVAAVLPWKSSQLGRKEMGRKEVGNLVLLILLWPKHDIDKFVPRIVVLLTGQNTQLLKYMYIGMGCWKFVSYYQIVNRTTPRFIRIVCIIKYDISRLSVEHSISLTSWVVYYYFFDKFTRDSRRLWANIMFNSI